MSWIKVLAHDMRCGLLRRRYLLAPGLVILACLYLGEAARAAGVSPSVGDMMLYAFGGVEPIVGHNLRDFLEMPFRWLMIMSGVLLIELDYMLSDLTSSGQQVIVRCRGRSRWFLSKCVWNFLSTGLCFAAMVLTAALCALSFGGRMTLKSTFELSRLIGGRYVTEGFSLTAGQTFVVGILSPFVTMAALGMAQMTLCLFARPSVSFLITQIELIAAVFWKSPLCLGEGAMVMRSAWVATDGMGAEYAGVSPGASIVFALAVLAVCIAAGAARFRRADILGMEE